MTDQHPLTDEVCEDLTPTYPLEELNYYMRAAADWRLERVIDAWNDAIQEEAECGIRSHSEKRAADMKRDYPVLTRFGVVLEAMRSNEEDK